MFELNHLRSFIAVATELNFRRAAIQLNMTQPPLSRQIQLLEHILGVQLFDRRGRSVRLTDAGRRFLPEAQDLLRRAEGAALSARLAASGVSGTIVLGFIPIAAFCILPKVVAILRQELPMVEVILKEMSTIDQMEALPSGQIDLGIMRPPTQKRRVVFSELMEESYLLAVHKTHPLATKPQVSISDLHDQDFLMYSPSDGWYGYYQMTTLFHLENIAPRFKQYFDQSLTILSMVNSGEGLTLTPESFKTIEFPNVVFRSVDIPSCIVSKYSLGWTEQTPEKSVLKRVRQAVIEGFESQ